MGPWQEAWRSTKAQNALLVSWRCIFQLVELAGKELAEAANTVPQILEALPAAGQKGPAWPPGARGAEGERSRRQRSPASHLHAQDITAQAPDPHRYHLRDGRLPILNTRLFILWTLQTRNFLSFWEAFLSTLANKSHTRYYMVKNSILLQQGEQSPAFIPVWAFLNLCIFIPVRKNQVCQRSFKALFFVWTITSARGKPQDRKKLPSCLVSFPRKPVHPNKMGLLYSSSNVPKTVLFLEFVVPSWNEMHSPLRQLGQHHEVMSEGKYKSRMENYTYCEVSGMNPGVTALEQTLRGDQGSQRSEAAQEIIHKSLNNCHSLGKNRLKRKQVTRSKVKGHWVELEARPGSIAECWCCRQMPARARTSSRKQRAQKRNLPRTWGVHVQTGLAIVSLQRQSWHWTKLGCSLSHLEKSWPYMPINPQENEYFFSSEGRPQCQLTQSKQGLCISRIIWERKGPNE